MGHGLHLGHSMHSESVGKVHKHELYKPFLPKRSENASRPGVSRTILRTEVPALRAPFLSHMKILPKTSKEPRPGRLELSKQWAKAAAFAARPVATTPASPIVSPFAHGEA